MRARKLFSIVAIAGGMLVLPVLPAQAAPSGGCPTPPASPVLSLKLNPSTVRGTAASIVGGTFTLNGCAISGAKIHVQTRPLVSGKPAGTWKTVATVTTGTHGGWRTSLAPGHNVRVRSFFSKTGSFPTTFSSVQTLLDAIRITMHPTTPSGCKIHLTGATTPVQANRRVYIQSRGPQGHFQGWTNVGTSKTHSDGTYSTTAVANCATTYNLRVFMYGDSTHAAGHSATTFGIKPHH